MSQLADALAGVIAEAGRLGADDVEVSRAGGVTEFVRFAGSQFNQVGETRHELVRVRVLVGRRLGVAVSASLQPDELSAAAAHAIAMARKTPPLELDFAFARPEADAGAPPAAARPEVPGSDSWPAELRRAFDRVPGVGLFGVLKVRRRAFAVATRAGLWQTHDSDDLQFETIAQIGDGAGWAGWYGPIAGQLDLVALVERAAEIARKNRGGGSLDPGPRDVVLAPSATARLVEWISLASFGARGVLEGRSFLRGRRGELLCSPRVSLRETVAASDLPFDSEGVRRQSVDLISAGRAGAPVSDLLTTARLKDGRPSTGHAPPIGFQSERFGPAPAHLVFEPGNDSEADLIGRVERGVYVTRLHYVNGMLDPRRAVMTGMTRSGTFAIEDGAIGRPLVNLRFTDSILDAFGEDRLGGVGRDLVSSPGVWAQNCQIDCPALLLRRFQFTGSSR